MSEVLCQQLLHYTELRSSVFNIFILQDAEYFTDHKLRTIGFADVNKPLIRQLTPNKLWGHAAIYLGTTSVSFISTYQLGGRNAHSSELVGRIYGADFSSWCHIGERPLAINRTLNVNISLIPVIDLPDSTESHPLL
jgi:hypothetical protein